MKRLKELNKLNKFIRAFTSAIWQQAAHTTYRLSFRSCSTRAIQETYLLTKKLQNFRKTVRRMDN